MERKLSSPTNRGRVFRSTIDIIAPHRNTAIRIGVFLSTEALMAANDQKPLQETSELLGAMGYEQSQEESGDAATGPPPKMVLIISSQ